MDSQFALLDHQGKILFLTKVQSPLQNKDILGKSVWSWTLGEDINAHKLAVGQAIMGDQSHCRFRTLIHARVYEWDCVFTPVPLTPVAIVVTYKLVPSALSRLTERERQVAWLTSRGFTSARILKELGISHSTLDTYRTRLKKKLDVDSSELLAWCVRHSELLSGQ